MESNFQSGEWFMLKHNNELPRGKGKIHYGLFINQSNGAGQTLLNYRLTLSHGMAMSWRHFSSLRSALPFLIN